MATNSNQTGGLLAAPAESPSDLLISARRNGIEMFTCELLLLSRTSPAWVITFPDRETEAGRSPPIVIVSK